MSKYIITIQPHNQTELYHFGVKGMRWGVRRDAQILANHYHNNRRSKINDDYNAGRITKQQRKELIKKSRGEKKQYLADIKKRFESTDSDKERQKISSSIVNKTTKEVPNAKLKRGLSTASRVLSGVMIGATVASGVGMGALAATAGSAALGAAAIGSTTVSAAAAVGDHYIREHILNVTD